MWAQMNTHPVSRTGIKNSDICLLVLHRWCTRRQIMARALRGAMHRRAHSMGLYALSRTCVQLHTHLTGHPAGPSSPKAC